MKTKHLLDNEEILTQSTDKTVTLTNYRIRYKESELKKARIASIMLEKISAIEIDYKSKPFFLLLSILCFIGVAFLLSFPYPNTILAFVIIIIGFLLLIYYLSTRKYVISIVSDSGVAILMKIRGMKIEEITNLINYIEQAKNNRYKNR